ncbi:uncharacterized protein LOC123293679 isoform X1 [Chrysoperla carnea]|uniref:uncharacterized protein LOC123293679 isoform X1 n=1 Tax=Chrysoperla carnea TaxID=189513 RepID=UPI001D07CB0B|nr:uncharacterized protein LOC123293679 isoform X1 [Chrysoperla carnea]
MEDTDANMFLIYLMDRFVWMLLITVFTTAVLQQCGVVATNEFHETSTPLQENFQFEMEPDNKIFDYAVRQKRQQSPSVSSPVIDGLFNPSTISSKPHDQEYSKSSKTTKWPINNNHPEVFNLIPMDSIHVGVQITNREHPDYREEDASLIYRLNNINNKLYNSNYGYIPSVDAYI